MEEGSIVALVTPFTKDEAIDEERLRFLINWHIENETDAVLVCGTTGESATLTHREHKEVIKIAAEEAKGRIPIVAGVGSNSTREALELGEFAKTVGVSSLLVITPYYNKPTQEGLYQHYKKIVTTVKMPVIIYNVPSRTGVNILPETVARLSKEFKDIVGIKEASGCLDQITKLMNLVERRFVLLSGSDEITLPILSIGGRGVISVVANIEPKKVHRLVTTFLNGKLEEAREIQLYLYDLIKALFIETNPIPVKTALFLMGLVEAVWRLPLCPMNESNKEKLRSVLKRYGLLQ
ncbi:MAG: 4-hydroxy-tetrahydrodipicolinate synthase [Candidatus Omnitrophica bacterium 4484_70.1]|nr:MAG: 4-hydroxy-tetrahydrodipicolinate synthase [Candidatus Omnitrophica bacterium 4484_70.1]